MTVAASLQAIYGWRGAQPENMEVHWEDHYLKAAQDRGCSSSGSSSSGSSGGVREESVWLNSNYR